MPYRRFPKTDTARLKSLKTLLDNNDTYAARQRFLDWQTVNSAKSLYDRLLTQSRQFLICYEAQMRNYRRLAKPQANMTLYVTHFVKVLFMSVERGEIKRAALASFYGITPDSEEEMWRQLKNADYLCGFAPKLVEGEKRRIAAGGRPIYNPTIGMVATHFDIFRDIYEQQAILNDKAGRALDVLKETRREVDSRLVEIWNAVEEHYADLPVDDRVEACRKFGLIYYYRTGEKRPNELH